jgi:hypothetical protein
MMAYAMATVVLGLSSSLQTLIIYSYRHGSQIPVAARSKACVCGFSLAGIAGSNRTGSLISVSCECCVLSGRDLCDRLITRPGESYQVWSV